MKRMTALLVAGLMVFGLTGCGSAENTVTTKEQTPAEVTTAADTAAETAAQPAGTEAAVPESSSEPETETVAETAAETPEETAPAHSDILVAFFSATGTTKGVAEKIAKVTGGDLYEILAAEPYSADDLNYNDSSSRTTREQNDKDARPEIGSDPVDLTGYKTIYLGFPIWWGEEPRILDTFAESYSFEGITVIPFCTSGGSGIGRSGSNMEELAGSGTWLEGKRLSGSVSEEDLQDWIAGLQ